MSKSILSFESKLNDIQILREEYFEQHRLPSPNVQITRIKNHQSTPLAQPVKVPEQVQ